MPTIRVVSGGFQGREVAKLGPFFSQLRSDLSDLGFGDGDAERPYTLQTKYANGDIDNFESLMLDDLDGVDLILALDSRAFFPVVQSRSGGGRRGHGPGGNRATVQDGPPIIAAITSEPILYGMVKDLTRPGTRITGIYVPMSQLTATRFRLIKAAVPAAKRIAILRYIGHRRGELTSSIHQIAEQAAHLLQMQIVCDITLVSTDKETEIRAKIEHGLRTGQPGGKPDALVLLHDAIMNYYATTIIQAVNEAEIPAIYGFAKFVELGGMMGYGPDEDEWTKQIAWYVALLLDQLPKPDPENTAMQPILKYAYAWNSATTLPGVHDPGPP